MLLLELVDVCSDLAFLRVIKFLKNLLDVVQVLIPVILVILCMIDFVKALFSGEDKKITSKIVKRIFSAVIVFFIIPIINYFFQLLGEGDVDASDCWNNANDSNIEILAELERAELEARKAEEAKRIEEIYKERERLIDAAKNRADQVPETGQNSSGSSVGGYIYYNQGSYSHVGYCSVKNGSTVQSAGCSAASFAIMASNLVNESYDPVMVANWLCANIHGGGALPAEKLINQQFLDQFGLNGERLFGDIGQSNIDSAKQNILDALNQGKMIILYIPGHYLALGRADNNQVVLLDPGKKANNGTYSIDQVWELTKNYKNRCSTKGNCGWHGAFAYSKK